MLKPSRSLREAFAKDIALRRLVPCGVIVVSSIMAAVGCTGFVTDEDGLTLDDSDSKPAGLGGGPSTTAGSSGQGDATSRPGSGATSSGGFQPSGGATTGGDSNSGSSGTPTEPVGGQGATAGTSGGMTSGGNDDPVGGSAQGGSANGGAPSEPQGDGSCRLFLDGGTGDEPNGQIAVCCTPSGEEQADIDEVFRLLNEHRMANGESALATDVQLQEAIQGHCRHMAEHGFFDHTAPEASVSQPGDRADHCGTNASGENIASGHRSPEAVMDGWKNSSGHNRNMLSGSYSRVGIGRYEREWGQIFSR